MPGDYYGTEINRVNMEQQQLMAVSPMVWLLARRIRIGGG